MYLKKLIKTNKSVFTIRELKNLFAVEDDNYVRVVISRMVKNGELQRVYQGIYSYKQEINTSEMANKIKTPSYVSLETVLTKTGIVFRDYGKKIFSVSDNTVLKQVELNGSTIEFQYQKIKSEILSNPSGINFGQVIEASPERAICDRIYLTPNYYFDNLERVNKKKLLMLAGLYNKRVYKEVEAYAQ